jgi:hypothetical protein
MTQPHPTTRIRSEYQPRNTPDFVAKWEKWTNEAPNDLAALIQLTYFQALQIRAIKLILVSMLVIVPIIATVGFFALSALVDKPTSRF